MLTSLVSNLSLLLSQSGPFNEYTNRGLFFPCMRLALMTFTGLIFFDALLGFYNTVKCSEAIKDKKSPNFNAICAAFPKLHQEGLLVLWQFAQRIKERELGHKSRWAGRK